MKSKMNPLFIAIFMLSIFSGCLTEDFEKAGQQEVKQYKIAVVMPATGHERWERTASWALDNIRRAQAGLPSRIEMNIEWHDEYDDLSEEYFQEIASDESVVAMIGPISSANARKAAEIMVEIQKPLILPIASSTEFQRIFGGKDCIWNLVESDITQSEILLTQAKLSGMTEVSLLTSDDDYGKSFSDWFAYQATELGLGITDIFIYRTRDELMDAVVKMSEYKRPHSTLLLFAPGRASDAIIFDKKIGELKNGKDYLPFPAVMCSDVVNTDEISAGLVNTAYEGISLSADPTSGFDNAYRMRFGCQPNNGEAHLYDAFLLLAYSLRANNGENLGETIKRIVDGEESGCQSWLPDDMKETFSLLAEGRLPDLRGVTGDWTFDKRHHASVINTIYSHWVLRDGKFTTVEYLSTDGSPRTSSTFQAWDNQTCVYQDFDSSQPTRSYGDLRGNYAVVISTSDTWSNYRHQADALAMYQLLKRHGYDDDHIILIIEDNIAFDSRNIAPGNIWIRPDGENMYHDVKVDYKLSDMEFDDFHKIMTGQSTDRLPEVLDTGCNDNIILFWCGHGNKNQLAWGSRDVVRGEDMRELIETMDIGDRYRKMLVVMDACYSGSIAEACTGLPGILFFTAANAYETSKADMKDSRMGIWLSNGFTRVFQETIDADPTISLRNLYYIVARQTTGSHATVYNQDYFDNLFTSYMNEFLK